MKITRAVRGSSSKRWLSVGCVRAFGLAGDETRSRAAFICLMKLRQ